MNEQDKEIRLDRTGDRAANEPEVPGDNKIKPSDDPSTNETVGNAANKNLTNASSGNEEGSPDFSNDETAGNTNDDQ